MKIKITPTLFDPWQEIQSYEQTIITPTGKFGATGVFVGTMRDFNEDETVSEMFLEHYPGMTEKQLQSIVFEAKQQWSIIEELIVHRVGNIKPGESIVLVAIWSAHRHAAFAASRYIMEALKSKAPFWKKEILPGHVERWVSKNTDGF